MLILYLLLLQQDSFYVTIDQLFLFHLVDDVHFLHVLNVQVLIEDHEHVLENIQNVLNKIKFERIILDLP